MDPLENDDLLTEIVRALVDNPQAVRVTETKDNGVSRLKIFVDPKDQGKVIGKEGKTIGAMRVLFGRIGAVDKRRIYIEMNGDHREE
jgi:predicted RNA-binding protein YlqC (UPF0109 family)